MQAISKSLDFIVDTASGDHPFDQYLSLLKATGAYVLVGFPGEIKFSPASLIIGTFTFQLFRLEMTSSLIEDCSSKYLQS